VCVCVYVWGGFVVCVFVCVWGGFVVCVFVCVCVWGEVCSVCFVVCVFVFSLILTEYFPCFLLNCKANGRVKLAKTGHGPHSSTLVVICVVLLLFVLLFVLFVCKCVLPPGDNPNAVNKYIIS
jgi:hypothetical protein